MYNYLEWIYISSSILVYRRIRVLLHINFINLSIKETKKNYQSQRFMFTQKISKKILLNKTI